MNKTIWIILGLILVVAGVWQAMNKSDNTPKSTAATDALTFATIEQDVTSGTASLYDVRTEEEYASGHFSNAILHDLQDIQRGVYPNEAKDKKIYLYCRSGNRSAQAAKALKAAGFTNIIDLGGLSNVQSIGGVLQQ